MKYQIGYMEAELQKDVSGELNMEFGNAEDFFPIQPEVIFDEKQEAVEEVNRLQNIEIFEKMFEEKSFNAEGDKIKIFCYDEIEGE